MLNRIFSTDSPKAVKADAYGYINAIHYMAPYDLAGVGNLCSHSTAPCRALCLGVTSGQAGMVHDINSDRDQGNAVRASRKAKARRFMRDRANYLLDFVRSLDLVLAQAARMLKLPCVRPNGSTDIAFEGIRFTIERDSKGYAVKVTLGGADAKNIFEHYPSVQFVDYTKNPNRFARQLPPNYHLTFSRSESNEAVATQLLRNGHNVAVVYANAAEVVARGYTENFYNHFRVVDGDKHDLRHLDPRAAPGQWGYVIALSPKGRKAKKDTSGFVVR